MKKHNVILIILSIGILVMVFTVTPFSIEKNVPADDDIVGAWKGKVQFTTGAFASVKDLEFMWVFNEGGTLTESSNYDGAPPVPPAYGIWRKTGDRQYEARYEFYWTKVPSDFEELTKGSGFSPAGYGVLWEKITLSFDGKSYKSSIKYDGFDQTGKQINFGDQADAEVKRMEF